jgi:D-serine deaminase-like pyridoxal phosphate-dependent protein
MNREESTTPALIVDLDLMEANLERMAAFFRGIPAKLRPHFKNHTCPDLAWRQLDSGAIGITCATLGEAECLVHHGFRGVLLANEIVDLAKIRRFVDLARRADMIVCIDNENNAADLARKAADLGLRFLGLMGYEGHMLHMPPGPETARAAAAAMAPLIDTKTALDKTGMPVEVVSVGGTGTYSLSGCYPGVTEIQAGSYLLMDTDYQQCCADFIPALTLLTTVISKTGGERIVTDAGLKALSCERGVPAVKNPPELKTRRLTAEHGIIDLLDPSARVAVGDRIEMWVHHSDATVNLHERIYGMRNGRVEEILRVEG